MAVVFLYQITVFYNKTQQHHFWNFTLIIQFNANCVHAPAVAAINKEVADGADGSM